MHWVAICIFYLNMLLVYSFGVNDLILLCIWFCYAFNWYHILWNCTINYRLSLFVFVCWN